MATLRTATLPVGALLQAYAGSGGYTDCYAVDVARATSLAEFMAAFYATPVFKLERWMLALALRRPSTDSDVLALAHGRSNSFAAWHVEGRDATQALLAAGRTRSWLMVAPHAGASAAGTTLYFGSAVVPRKQGGMGWAFTALLGFHKLYSRVLLRSAVRRLARS